MSERTKPLESDWARMPDPAGAVERMRMARKEQAAQFAANVLPIIRDIQKAGHTSLNAIAGQLNARKVATANGGQWRHVQVRQILGRAGAARRTAVPRPGHANEAGAQSNAGGRLAGQGQFQLY
jgi:Recombinase